jgi:hypothetical protein
MAIHTRSYSRTYILPLLRLEVMLGRGVSI